VIYNLGQTVRIGPSATTTGLELRDATGALVNATTNALTVVTPNNTVRTPVAVNPSTGIYYADTTGDQSGIWTWRWAFTVGTSTSVADGTFNVEPAPVERAAFATASDFQARIGRTLTAPEVVHVNALLVLASHAIAAACDKTEAWIANLVAVPLALRVTCIEAAVRAFVNPDGARARQEQLGQYGSSLTWAAATPAGVGLTDPEVLLVRRAVFGLVLAPASSRVGSILDTPIVCVIAPIAS